jgi:hypothetical protein
MLDGLRHWLYDCGVRFLCSSVGADGGGDEARLRFNPPPQGRESTGAENLGARGSRPSRVCLPRTRNLAATTRNVPIELAQMANKQTPMNRTNGTNGTNQNQTKSNRIKPNQTLCLKAIRKPGKRAKCAEVPMLVRLMYYRGCSNGLPRILANTGESNQIKPNQTACRVRRL